MAEDTRWVGAGDAGTPPSGDRYGQGDRRGQHARYERDARYAQGDGYDQGSELWRPTADAPSAPSRGYGAAGGPPNDGGPRPGAFGTDDRTVIAGRLVETPRADDRTIITGRLLDADPPHDGGGFFEGVGPAGPDGQEPDEQDTDTRRRSGSPRGRLRKDGTRRRRFLPWKHRSALTPKQLRVRKIVGRSIMAACAVFFSIVGYSVDQALSYPGTDSVEARLAEWARDHGLGSVITWMEQIQYDLNPPKKGGNLSQNQLNELTAGLQPPAKTPSAKPGGKGAKEPADYVPLHAPMQTPVTPALPGEGVFRPLVVVHGQPVVQYTFVRPDPIHTSYLAAVVWISQKDAKFDLHPGMREPGGTFDVPPTIPEGDRTGLIATWNGGFKVTDGGSHGGFYLDGQTTGTLRDGAAAEVFYKDGHMTVGQWGRDVSMTPDVVGVRQCLQLMVDGGQLSPQIGDESVWGASDRGADYVERSGIGVTKSGDMVYVAGNVLSGSTLAQVLLDGGAWRAMPLDMNREWPSFMSYQPDGNPADPTPTNLIDFGDPADRYYWEATRDFVAVYSR
jgi:hypothetical protein